MVELYQAQFGFLMFFLGFFLALTIKRFIDWMRND